MDAVALYAHCLLIDTILDTAVRKTIASTTLRYSANTERSTASTSYALLKEMIALNSGQVRVKVDGKKSYASNSYVAIYLNGVVYVEINPSQGSYTTYTYDIAIKAGDRIQIYAKTGDGGYSTYAKNFQLYFDFTDVNGIVITD